MHGMLQSLLQEVQLAAILQLSRTMDIHNKIENRTDSKGIKWSMIYYSGKDYAYLQKCISSWTPKAGIITTDSAHKQTGKGNTKYNLNFMHK